MNRVKHLVSRESDKAVRDANWYVEESLLKELSKPGLTAEERKRIADNLRMQRINTRQWEEQNCDNWKKHGEFIGSAKMFVAMIGGLAAGFTIGVIKNIVRI